MTKTLLIDGDILAYRTASAVEYAVCWDADQDIWTLTADAREAKQRLDLEIVYLKQRLEADKVLIAFSDTKNFRKEVLPTYKWNRKGTRKPVILPELRDYCIDAYPTRVLPGLEADDVLGVLGTSRTLKGTKIIVSEDKDLLQIPGYIYRPSEDAVHKITKLKADRWFFTQVLTGDSTDGYSGLPGCGPKTAEKILQVGCWDEVVEAYENKGLNENEALTQARVARILRAPDYDLRTKKVKLWTPKSPTSPK